METKVRIEGDKQLMQNFQALPVQIQKRARWRVKAAAFALMRRIVFEMPRLTGRAAASWGKWTPSFLIENEDAKKGDAIWEIEDDGLTITQGTNVPYVKSLNEGTSTQSPRGFIDKAADEAQRALEDSVNKLLDEVFG